MIGANVELPKLRQYNRELSDITQQIRRRKAKIEQSLDQTKAIWNDTVFQEYLRSFQSMNIEIDKFLQQSEKIHEVLQNKISLLERYLKVR